MSDHFTHLQQAIQNMMHLPNFNSEMVVKRILDEDALIRRRRELGLLANPSSVTVTIPSQSASASLSLNTRPRGPKAICANCKRENHVADFCISPGGKMAGCSVDEARAAYWNALPKLRINDLPEPTTRTHR